MCRFHSDRAFIVAALVAVLLPVCGEGSPIVFERTYGGPSDELGLSAVQTADGGYIIAGITESFGAGGFDCYVVKTGPHGDTQWTRTIGGPKFDGGWSVVQTADSGYVVTGYTCSVDTLGDAWLIKIDANGDTVWSRTYGAMQGSSGMLVQQTHDGGYVITGRTLLFGPGGPDVLLIRTDSIGDTLWTRTYGGAGDDGGSSVQQTTDGGYIIVANTSSFGAGGQVAWLIKTDSTGDTLWTRTFGNDDSMAFGGSVQQTADSGYFVAGYRWPWSSDSASFYLIRTNGRGDTIWTKTIDGPGGWAEGVWGQQVKDGGYIIVGACSTDVPAVYLVRTNANGDTLWTRTFGGPDFDVGYSVQETDDGGFVIAGQTYSFGAGRSDFYLIKSDENGRLAVAEPKADTPRASVRSLTCEPNPFRGSMRISLSVQIPAADPVSLRIYDVQGRLVRTLGSGQVPQADWDGRDDAGQLLRSGTYLIRCDVSGEHVTARVVLQR
jgi:hypothetical protein